ncbi:MULTISPECIES: hypothetical protein [Pseudomonas]|uniref:hypothetical protein n=1 Tax=Pseudomonas TaxID=286 RepID=UPI00164593DD|nr:MULTISPECIES: hypothetical protein [Pseudomonas]QXI35815.1 hypothetical protein HU725_010960 [Pseudomonas promysalinigenes]
MVVDSGLLAERIVGSPIYKKLLSELVDVLHIEVESEYTEVFARLDSAKVARAKVDIDELMLALTDNFDLLRGYSISKFRALSAEEEDEEEYPAGAEPSEDEKSKTLSVGKYSQGFLLTNLIEYVLAKSSREQLLEYLKLSRIPRAKKYADQLFKLVKLV